MILMHTDRNMRIHFGQGLDHRLQHDIASIITRTPTGLNNHRRIDTISRLQNGQALFHIVNVKGRNAIAMLGSVIKKLAKGNQHAIILCQSKIQGLFMTYSG